MGMAVQKYAIRVLAFLSRCNKQFKFCEIVDQQTVC